MAVTKTLVKTCNGANNQTLDGTYTLTADEELNFSSLLTTTYSNQSFAFGGSILTSLLQVFFAIMTATNTAATLQLNFNTTNSTTTNAKSIVLSAGVPYSWDIDSGFTNPFPAVPIINFFATTSFVGCQLDISTLLLV